MAMTDAMNEVDYTTADFNQLEDSENSYDSYDASLKRHPLWMTEGHFIYHLYRDADDKLAFIKDIHGEPVCSPRKLRELCLYETVSQQGRLETMKLNALPSDLYPSLLTEAILQRQLKALAHLVSTWPFPLLHVQSLIPSEEPVSSDYLTVSAENGECMSLMDSFSLGLLNLKPHSRLRCVNFTGFRHDRRLCKELLRLPIVWMKPADRQSGYLHSILRKTLADAAEMLRHSIVSAWERVMAATFSVLKYSFKAGSVLCFFSRLHHHGDYGDPCHVSQAVPVTEGTNEEVGQGLGQLWVVNPDASISAISKDKVQRYLNRISCIYSNIDLLVRHGHMFGPVTIVLDCKLTIDDVPIGLALQGHTPFRYVCQRAWLEVLPDVCLPVSLLNKVLESRYLTHIEIEDSQVCSDSSRWESLLEGLSLLSELQCLSLPNSIHVTQLPTAAIQLGHVLNSLGKLRKLSLASCTMRDSLGDLLPMLTCDFTYLNLRDCRLTPSDLRTLLLWPGVSSLRELNLSRNNLSSLASMVATLLTRMALITCFSVSYCSLSMEGLRQIVRHCLDCQFLKVLCVQSFIPPPLYEVKGILEECANIPTIQKCVLLPEAYAFPGTHISQRADNHTRTVILCSQYLDQLGRPDIELE